MEFLLLLKRVWGFEIMTVIDGKLVSSKMRDELKNMISDAGTKYGKIFKLTVIIVGNDPASEIYVRNKEKA